MDDYVRCRSHYAATNHGTNIYWCMFAGQFDNCRRFSGVQCIRNELSNNLLNLTLISTCFVCPQGSLTTSFSTVSYYKDINTLSALDESGLPIVTSSPTLKNLFGSEEDASPVLKSLIKKFLIYEIENQMNQTAFERNICSIERYSDVTIIIKVKLANKFKHFEFY